GTYAQRYAADGTPRGSEFRVDPGNSFGGGAPVAMDPDGEFLVTWRGYYSLFALQDVFAQRYAADGTPVGSAFLVNTYTTDDQGPQSVAMDADGDFVIVWTSEYQDGSGDGVYARQFASDGTPEGSEFRVNSYTTGHQDGGRVAMDATGDFVITWDSGY